MGLDTINNVTLDNITGIANQTSLADFLVQHNNIIFGGTFWFLILLTLWFILFRGSNVVRDQPLNNLMYSGGIISLLALLLRAMGLMTDWLMWIPIIVTILTATIIWAIKE